MAFQMSYSKEELSGAPPLPSGPYTLQFKGFKPKAAKPNTAKGETESTSINYNPELVVIGHPEYEGRRVFAGLNSKAGFIIIDFCHALGVPMEVVQDGNEGTEKEQYAIPGVFDGIDQYPTEPEKWKYLGPLLNKTMQVELAEIPAQGGYKAKNEVRQYICAVPGCTEKHSTNLIKS